jgi:hypothetical protein
MTYHISNTGRALMGVGLGDLSAGDVVTIRFRPGLGVNARTSVRVIDELRTALLGTNHFGSPDYLGWGAGGTIVYRGKVRSANYTLRQIANMMPRIAQNVSTRSGLPLTFLSVLDKSGDERVAEQPDAAPPGGSTPGGGDQPEPPVPVVPDADARLQARIEEETGLSPLTWAAILGTFGAVVLWLGRKEG